MLEGHVALMNHLVDSRARALYEGEMATGGGIENRSYHPLDDIGGASAIFGPELVG
jgi:hypothetical protein